MDLLTSTVQIFKNYLIIVKIITAQLLKFFTSKDT